MCCQRLYVEITSAKHHSAVCIVVRPVNMDNVVNKLDVQQLVWSEYSQTSNITHNKSQSLNVSYLVLQSSLPNPLRSGVKSIIQLQLSDQQLYFSKVLIMIMVYGMFGLFDYFSCDR